MDNYGINSMVQDKVDAYRGDPQALASSYQKNQQLIDLLALQKLKTEKESAARELQLAAQQNPATIAQQREQELLGMTKNEIARDMGPGVQQAGQQMAQAQAQGAPQGGIAELPTPNMAQGMADGGIVAFAGGGMPTLAPTPMETARIVKWLAEKGIDATGWSADKLMQFAKTVAEGSPGASRAERDIPEGGNMPPISEVASDAYGRAKEAVGGAMDFMGQRNDRTGQAETLQGTGGGILDVLSGRGRGTDTEQPPAESAGTPEASGDPFASLSAAYTPAGGSNGLEPLANWAKERPLFQRLAGMMGGEGEAAPEEVIAAEEVVEPSAVPVPAVAGGADNAPMPGALGGITDVLRSRQRPTMAPAAELPEDIAALQKGVSAAQLRGIEQDPTKRGEEWRTNTAEYLAMSPEEKAAYQTTIQRLQEMDASKRDPEARARENLQNLLLGMGTGRGIAGALGGAARGRSASVANQEAGDKSRLMEIFNAQKGFGEAERGIREKAQQAGNTAYERASTEMTTALSTAANSVSNYLTREQNERLANFQNDLAVRELEMNEARNLAARGQLSRQSYDDAVSNLSTAFKNNIDALTSAKESLSASPETIQRIDAQIEAARKAYNSSLQGLGVPAEDFNAPVTDPNDPAAAFYQ